MGGGEEERKSLPLPVPLLLKYDISETAGAPKEVKKKWKPVGSQGRRVKWGGGGKFQRNKEGPQEPAHFPQRPDIWDTVGSWRRGSPGRLSV